LVVVAVEIELLRVLRGVRVVLVVEPLLHTMELQLPFLVAAQSQLQCKVIAVAIQALLVLMCVMVEAVVQVRLVVMYQARRRRLEVVAQVYPVQLQALLLPVAVAVEAETVKCHPVLEVLVEAVMVAQVAP
jgi:hypothetical protein